MDQAPLPLDIDRQGTGPSVWLIHGAVLGGRATWSRQADLAERWSLSIVNRPGFGGSPIDGRTDWKAEGERLSAELNEPTHLVGHSYGTMVVLVMAARRPERIRSITLIEPPTYALLEGDAEADEFIAAVDRTRVQHADDPGAALAAFSRMLGLDAPPPGDLPPPVQAGVRLFLGERLPWEGEPPLRAVRDAEMTKLVVSCTESPLRMRAAEALADAIGAESQTLDGGHNLQRRGGPLNDLLERLWLAESRSQHP